MRLTKIKLSGFKSFAEPIGIDFTNDMIGVVGPNGCGKSNIVDAVRWVMGETSRHIRAMTLEDVIFSGTNSRKPVGQASVELIFDNTDGSVGVAGSGKFAQYTELSLSRTVTRDRDSKYFINGSRCRRRDIADIFFGTGLGVNSYAVIEQGMIARVVEAKPEEVRSYIEEAAGVSQYKERRRDTENRNRHTRDNLERVMDIRDEVDKQLGKLKRQVKSAEKFKQLRKDKERFESEFLLLKYRQREEERTAREKEVEDRRLDFEKIQATLRQVEADAEQKRAAVAESNDVLHHLKEEHYRLAARISGEEQDLENRKKSVERLHEESEEVKALAQSNAHEIKKQQDLLVERGQRGDELDKEVSHLEGEVERLREERDAARQMLHEKAQERQDEIKRISGEVAIFRDKVHDLAEALNAQQSKGNEIQGRLSSLESLQEATLQSGEDAFSHWLDTAGLKRKDRLVENIRVDEGWERVVELVLGSFISGIEVASLEECAVHVGDFNQGTLVLLEPDTASAGGDTLADKVSGSHSLGGLLGRVRVVDSLEQALSRRSSLAPHESLITRDGVWVGLNWIKVHAPDKDDESVLVRESRIEELRLQLKASNEASAALKQDIENARTDLARKEAQRDEVQAQLAATLKEAAQLESGVEHSDTAALEGVRRQLREAHESLHRVKLERESVKGEQNSAANHIKQLQSLEQEYEHRRNSIHETLDDLEQSMQETRQRLDGLLAEHSEEEQRLKQHNRKLVALQDKVKALEQRRGELGKQTETRRETYEQVRADLQVIIARSKDALVEFNKLGIESAMIEESMESDVSMEGQEQKLEQAQAAIDRLGAINLVALEEFDELSERKEYIDSQYDDLTRALKTLEEAIHKIDKETRERFKTTFDQVNANLRETFPRLFGSGEAQLELTDSDLLTTGISIMVRPPGKRRASINLLSGGEKALAAVAVVFAIFELNPAPFCLLDEVDAPLDEHNVERFCEMLKYMSARVQFIVITHNKVSMEYMDSLIGVTMQEPGVSRLVAVDVKEAVGMATA